MLAPSHSIAFVASLYIGLLCLFFHFPLTFSLSVREGREGRGQSAYTRWKRVSCFLY